MERTILRTPARLLLLAVLSVVLQSGNAAVLITKKGTRFEVEVRDRTEEGLIVYYQDSRFLVRWNNIDWISGTTIFTMANGKKLTLYAVEPVEGGWIVRPNWTDEDGKTFVVMRKLVKSLKTSPEIEQEYIRRLSKLETADSKAQFELLKWCLEHGRDDLAVKHANALRETRNAWNLAVVMQATLLGMPRSSIPASDEEAFQRAVERMIYRLVVKSRDSSHSASVGYRILAFDLASGQMDVHSEETKQYLKKLYSLASVATRASSSFEEVLKENKQLITCPKCKGSGKVRGRYLGQGIDERTGQLLSEGKALGIVNGFEMITCKRCSGTGKVYNEREIGRDPAGMKAAVGPDLWEQLVNAVREFLQAEPPVQLRFVHVKRK